jgi:Zn-dependent protease
MGGNISYSHLLVLIAVLLISMSIHEAMHAFVGLKLGDTTASDQGRVSLNPLRHIDPFMTVLLPAITIFLFGFPVLAARPVPFNPDRVKFDEFGAALIAAAGPLSNLLLAIIGATLLKFITFTGIANDVAMTFVTLNVALFVFNILPLPPLDGSRVLFAVAPEPVQRFMASIEPYGLFIVFGLVLFGGFGPIILHLNDSILNLLGV